MEYQRFFRMILEKSPGLDERRLTEMVEEKKTKVGGGYLTDKGALYLIASDLNLDLDYESASGVSLKEVLVGANEITVTARIQGIYPSKSFSRRDGGEGHFRRLVLYDSSSSLKATLWDERADLIDSLGLKIGDAVKITSGYVKAGLDGRPVLHVGDRGRLERLEGGEADRIPTIDRMVLDASKAASSPGTVAMDGIIETSPRSSAFTRKDGSEGSLTQFRVAGSDGRNWRCVLWQKNLEGTTLEPGARARLIGFRIRTTPHGEEEFHGDEASNIQIISPPSSMAPATRTTAYENVPIVTLRVISIGKRRPSKSPNGGETISALTVDREGNLLTVVGLGTACLTIEGIGTGSVIGLRKRPSSTGVIFVDTPESLTRTGDSSERLPDSLAYFKKIRDLKEGDSPVFVEVIALGHPVSQEVTTRDGTLARRGEVQVGDDTAEARLVAWRDQISMIEGILPGQRLRVCAVEVGKGGGRLQNLLIKNYSAVERLS